jgi:hypothetical protein
MCTQERRKCLQAPIKNKPSLFSHYCCLSSQSFNMASKRKIQAEQAFSGNLRKKPLLLQDIT